MRSSKSFPAADRDRIIAENSHILPPTVSWVDDKDESGNWHLESSDVNRMDALNDLSHATEAAFTWVTDQPAPAAASAEPVS